MHWRHRSLVHACYAKYDISPGSNEKLFKSSRYSIAVAGSLEGLQMLKTKLKDPSCVMVPTSPILAPWLRYSEGRLSYGSGMNKGIPYLFGKSCERTHHLEPGSFLKVSVSRLRVCSDRRTEILLSLQVWRCCKPMRFTASLMDGPMTSHARSRTRVFPFPPSVGTR